MPVEMSGTEVRACTAALTLTLGWRVVTERKAA